MGTYLNNNDVDSVLNQAYDIATGNTAMDSALTLKEIIDAGTADGGSLVGKKEQFTKALIMMWAKNIFEDTEFMEDDDDPYYVDSREYGAIIQMISAQAPDVQESHAWQEFTSGVSTVGTYTVYLPIVSTKYYGKTSSWELPIAISYQQYNDAFTSAQGFNEFRSYIFTVVRNKIKLHRKTMNDANRNNFMAEKIKYQDTVIQKGKYTVRINTAATAGDRINIGGVDFTWVANGGSVGTGDIELPNTSNAANQATALMNALNGVTGMKFTWTIVSGHTDTLQAEQKDGEVYAVWKDATVASKKYSNGAATTDTGVDSVMKVTNTEVIEMVNPKGVHVFKLIANYNAEMNPTAPITTKAQFLADKNCLRYFSRKLKEYMRYMRGQSALFNTENKVKFVPRNRMVVELLAYARDAVESVMQSDTFHDELVALPGFREVSAWEGLGETSNILGEYSAVDFEEVSRINIVTDGNVTVNKSGIVAFIADKWAILHTIREDRVAARNFDPEALDLYYYQFRDSYMNNLGMNAIVFILE